MASFSYEHSYRKVIIVLKSLLVSMDNCDCKNYNCIYIISTRNIAVCFWSISSKCIVFLVKISLSEECIFFYNWRNRIAYMNYMHTSILISTILN